MNSNSDFGTQVFREHESREHDFKTHYFRTHSPNEQSGNGHPAENAPALSTLHNLVLAEVFRAQPETLTVTELFQRTHGPFTASGLLDFTRAVVRLKEEGLLEPVLPQESIEGRAEKDGARLIGSSTGQDAAGGGCAPQISSSQIFSPQIFSPQIFSPKIFSPQIGAPQVSASTSCTPNIFVPKITDDCAPRGLDAYAAQFRDSAQVASSSDAQQRGSRYIKSAITTKGELHLFSQLLPGLLPEEALGKLAKSEIACGPALLVEPTSGPAVDHSIRHAPAGPEGNRGDAAPKLTSPHLTCSATGNGQDVAPRADTAPAATAVCVNMQSDSAQQRTEHWPSLMEQLFPEIFGTAKRLEDVCHCGELAQRTCPCGARTCHNHFYDGEGNLARRDHTGFCGECVDLIREEAAGIERYGRTQ